MTLTGAQLVVARHYGFPSWPRLKQHLELLDRYRRAPDEVRQTAGLADEFLALACLRYGDDVPERWSRAAGLLAAHPAITRQSIHVAAAVADADVVADLLAGDPALARAEGGPFGWEPLLYLAYARHDPDLTEAAALGTARVLLAHGADPNAGYLWHGLQPAFTALTGALGSGEGDQPQHPHGFPLARLLLAAGADANDGQALYNRQFSDDDRHLVLLLEHGLGRGDGGPWRARFGHTADSPYDLIRGQLWWAISARHARPGAAARRARRRPQLAVHAAPGGWSTGLRTSHGRTPAEVALICGCRELAGWLVEHGAPAPRPTGVDELHRRRGGRRPGAGHAAAGTAAAARAQRPGLIVWAAGRRDREAVALLADLGFDVNARGRVDVPIEQAWETALHSAAGEGDVALARLLLSLGADPDVRDGRFDSTPLGWAEHFGQQATIELLTPVTGTGQAR